ncbi:MAG: phosphoribosylamine--glycine ligase [Saprospiraceae bacterium]|nr:MAG: phosphoribosylamine--glycine ligase [Saprospiraceae bacterium]
MEKTTRKRRFLFVSRWGDLLDIVNAVQEEGNDVKMFIEYKPCLEVGDGFVPKVSEWQSHIAWADIVVFDYTGYGKIAEELRATGKPVFGGSEYTDKLEIDRSFGQDELKRHKINILKYKEFQTFSEAIAYVEAHPNSYVLKPSGETQDFKQLLFVGKEDDGSDIVRMLKAYEKSWGNMGAFQLQRRVRGVEVSVSAYFNGKEFIKPVNITFEHKKLFPKELGVSTGEMGTSMFWTDDNPIFDATLGRMEKTLAKDGFTGHIDINCIVNGKGIYPLEFTSRFGYPQVYIQREGISEPFGDMLFKLATGQSFKLKTKPGFQVGVYMVVPPFPYNDDKTFELFSKDAVVVFKDKSMKGIHPVHLQQVNGEWLITGDAGMPILVVGTGITMKEAQHLAYNRISNVFINNSYYRTDIGDRWTEDSDRLWAWKFL